MKKLVFYLLMFVPVITLADNKYDFVLFHYNIKSIGNKLTNAQCEKYFQRPVYYNINNDQSVYDNKGHTNHLTYIKYQRLAITYISPKLRLFYGKAQIRINKNTLLTEESNFLLNIGTRTIRGSFYVPLYCTGNFIGVQQNSNIWPT